MRDLVQTVRSVRLVDWLSFLARMQVALGADRMLDIERHVEVLDKALPPAFKEAILRFAQAVGRDRSPVLLCSERQMTTLMQVVLLHAPDNGPRRFDEPSDRMALGDALLMTQDVMNPSHAADLDDRLELCLESAARLAGVEGAGRL